MLTRLTTPVKHLVTLSELKAHLSITGNDDDVRLVHLLQAATEQIETDTQQIFTPQTWIETFEACFEHSFYDDWRNHYDKFAFPLTKSPVKQIESVKYFDTADAEQTISAYALIECNRGIYYVKLHDNPPKTAWRPDAFTITYTCDTNYNIIPSRAKQACLLLAGAYNELREAEISTLGTLIKPSHGYDRIIGSLARRYLSQGGKR